MSAPLVFELFMTFQHALGASLTAKIALLAGKTRHRGARPSLSIVRKPYSLTLQARCCDLLPPLQ